MKKYLLLFLVSTSAHAADVYYGINELGTRVGQRFYCTSPLGQVPCGIVTDAGGTREIINPTAMETEIHDINSAGNTVGYVIASSKMQATLNGAPVGPAGVAWSRARRINDAGQILIQYTTYNRLTRKYAYTECLLTGTWCAPLPKESAGGYSATYTSAMNGLGHTGGVYYLADQAKGFGFIRANGVTRTLEYPGAIITTVEGLNDLGVASGSACLKTSRDYWLAGATCLESVGFRWKDDVFEALQVSPQDINNNGSTAGE
jgi:hypothetical protein